MMTDMRPLFAISLVTLLLTACGQTGPLYLPGHEQGGKVIAKESVIEKEPVVDKEPVAENEPATAPVQEAK